MKTVGKVLESPLLSSHLAEGRRLLLLQRAADSALAELEAGVSCRIAGAAGTELELRVLDAAAAARLKQMIPSFLAVFNRAAKTEMRTAQVRVSPGEEMPPGAEINPR